MTNLGLMNGLWLTEERRTALRKSRAGNAEWLLPIAAAASEHGHSSSHHPADAIVGRALDAFFRADTPAAELVVHDWCAQAREARNHEDLSKAHVAMAGAVVADCVLGQCCKATLDDHKDAAHDLCTALLKVSKGNPHSPGNNWWAVTHSALFSLASALAALGDTCELCSRKPEELAEWSWARLRAFLGHFGPAGAYHEGLGYLGYTCNYLLPALLLRESRSGEAITSLVPGLAHLADLIFCAALEGEAPSDEAEGLPGWGRMLAWNDAGPGWLSGPAPLLAICFAPPENRRALRDRWDRLSGLSRSGKEHQFCASLFFHAVFYGEAGGKGSPLAPPLAVCDSLHGLWIARNRCRDERDAVAGAYARAYHPGGHSQNDSGSIRFSASGREWITGGGQARPEARYQSCLLPTDHEDSIRACGAPLFVSTEPPVFGMDLRRVYRAYGERYVALRPDPELAHLATLDLVDDHHTDRSWIWCLTYSPDLTCHLDDNRFLLVANDGTSLEGVFLLDKPETIELGQSPPSFRSFVSRPRAEYPGRPCLIARFQGPSLRVLVSLAVGSEPARLAADTGLDIAFGNDVWRRPFAHAFPEAVDPRQLHGQCLHPAG